MTIVFFKLQPKKYPSQANLVINLNIFYTKLSTFINSRGVDFKYNNSVFKLILDLTIFVFVQNIVFWKFEIPGLRHDNSVFKFNVKNEEHPNKTILVSGLSGFSRMKLCSFAINIKDVDFNSLLKQVPAQNYPKKALSVQNLKLFRFTWNIL